MVGPLGVLSAGLAAATTKIIEDVDGRPLGVFLAGPAAATTDVEEDVDGGPLGATSGSSSSHHQS
jgi:hypothetical protein